MKEPAMRALRVLDVVALLEDMPDEGLHRGQVGTLVEELAPGVFEVEFSDAGGQAYALLPVRAEQLLRLLHERAAPLETLAKQSTEAATS
jgi:hypothetical protein